jgi:hypothetical protein
MTDYKNLVVKSTDWVEIIVIGACFIGTILLSAFLYLLWGA